MPVPVDSVGAEGSELITWRPEGKVDLTSTLPESAWAAVTKHRRLRQQKSLPHGSGGRKSKIQAWWGWLLLRPLSLAYRWQSSPCVLTWAFLHVCLCPDPHFLQGLRSYQLRAHPYDLYLSPNLLSHSEVLGFRAAIYEFRGEHNLVHNAQYVCCSSVAGSKPSMAPMHLSSSEEIQKKARGTV